jgi:drug/metabolite transporter (DMT)-like permease
MPTLPLTQQRPIATTYAYLNPVVALFLGWLILNKKIIVGIVIGTILIILGVAAVLSGENRTDERTGGAS